MYNVFESVALIKVTLFSYAATCDCCYLVAAPSQLCPHVCTPESCLKLAHQPRPTHGAWAQPVHGLGRQSRDPARFVRAGGHKDLFYFADKDVDFAKARTHRRRCIGLAHSRSWYERMSRYVPLSIVSQAGKTDGCHHNCEKDGGQSKQL